MYIVHEYVCRLFILVSFNFVMLFFIVNLELISSVAEIVLVLNKTAANGSM